MQPFSSLLRASVLPPAAATLPSVQPPTFVRFLTFLYWLLSIVYFSLFAVTYFFILRCHLFSFIISRAFSYCLSFLLPDEASERNVAKSTVCFSTVFCSLNYYTSILFVLHKFRNFFCVAHFGAAILVFSARLGAASCCCNFAFCSTTYVRPLSHRSFLGFVTFVFSHFAVTYFAYFAVTFFNSLTHALSHTVFHFSYLMKPLGEMSSILLSIVLPSVAL